LQHVSALLCHPKGVHTGMLISPKPNRTEKTIQKSPLFVRRGGHCCRREMVGRTTWVFFFDWLAKVRVWSL